MLSRPRLSVACVACGIVAVSQAHIAGSLQKRLLSPKAPNSAPLPLRNSTIIFIRVMMADGSSKKPHALSFAEDTARDDCGGGGDNDNEGGTAAGRHRRR